MIKTGKSFLIIFMFIEKLLFKKTANEITDLYKIIEIYTMIQGRGTIIFKHKKIALYVHAVCTYSIPSILFLHRNLMQKKQE